MNKKNKLPPRRSKMKAFLLNRESRYDSKELVLNWIIIISLFLMLFFLVLFAIFTQDMSNSKTNDQSFDLEDDIFSFIAFFALLMLTIALIGKFISKIKRSKRQKNA